MKSLSSAAPDNPQRRCWEAVAAELAQDFRISPGVPFEPSVEVVSEAVVPVELIDEFEDDAGAEAVDLPDVMLAPQAG